MKVTVRMDDITPDMNWRNFNRTIELLEKYDAWPLLGIVPDNQDPMLVVEKPRDDFAQIILELQRKGAVLAMHGSNHVYTTKKGGIFPLNLFSEYAGVPFEVQKDKLSSAKEKLEALGISTDIFMAPGHTFDKNTLKALRELGFKYLTDGFGYKPFYQEGIAFLPIAFRKGKVYNEGSGMTTIVLHVNDWKEEDFASFEKLLSSKKDYFVSYSKWFEQDISQESIFKNIKDYLYATEKRILVSIMR